MTDLVLHPTTAKQLKLAVKNANHAYLFVGPDGLGKTSAALNFAAELLGVEIGGGDLSRWIYVVKPNQGKKISLAQVKDMAKFANQSKSASVKKKVVIIDDAEQISIEAANSLLLMLEEAPADTIFILVASGSESLPITVLSRLQTIHFYEPSKQQIVAFIQENGLDPDILEMAGARPAKLLNSELLDGQRQFSEKAVHFITADLEGRLFIAATLANKLETEEFINILARKLLTSQSQFSANRGESLILAQSHLYNNGNPKFVLECLALEFE